MTKAMMNRRHADASNKAENYERATAFLSSWIEDSLVVPPKAAKHPQSHLQFSTPLSNLPPPSGTLRRRSTISNDDNINSLVNSLQTSIMLQHEHQDQNRSSNYGVSPTCVGAVSHKELPSRRVRGVIPALPFGSRSQISSSRNPCGRDQLPSLRSASATPTERARHSHTDPCSSLRRSKSSGDHQRHRSCGDAPSKSQSGEVVRSNEPASADVHPSMKKTDEKKSTLPSNRPSQTKYSRKSKKSRLHTVATEGNPSTLATNKQSSSKASLSLDCLRELDGPNFDLGDSFRSTKYQVIESNPTKALHLANQLRIHDFAWVLRSSHEWTYAIVADFPNEGNEASIRFVIDKLGNTKTLKMKHWAKCIRLVDAKSMTD